MSLYLYSSFFSVYVVCERDTQGKLAALRILPSWYTMWCLISFLGYSRKIFNFLLKESKCSVSDTFAFSFSCLSTFLDDYDASLYPPQTFCTYLVKKCCLYSANFENVRTVCISINNKQRGLKLRELGVPRGKCWMWYGK